MSVKDDSIIFEQQNARMVEEQGNDQSLRKQTDDWFYNISKYGYSYHFRWCGRPIIQIPQDIVALQEIIWETKPDLIIETGIARGGSLIFYSSMLRLIGGDGIVVGIDIDIREHNRREIENHPFSDRITMIEGSSIDNSIAEQVRKIASGKKRVMACLDSNHTHSHVLDELNLYSPIVTKGCYMVVLDTVVEDLPADCVQDRPWGIGNNPKTAVHEFLQGNNRFEIDKSIQDKLLITVAPDGYLKCVED